MEARGSISKTRAELRNSSKVELSTPSNTTRRLLSKGSVYNALYSAVVTFRYFTLVITGATGAGAGVPAVTIPSGLPSCARSVKQSKSREPRKVKRISSDFPLSHHSVGKTASHKTGSHFTKYPNEKTVVYYPIIPETHDNWLKPSSSKISGSPELIHENHSPFDRIYHAE